MEKQISQQIGWIAFLEGSFRKASHAYRIGKQLLILSTSAEDPRPVPAYIRVTVGLGSTICACLSAC